MWKRLALLLMYPSTTLPSTQKKFPTLGYLYPSRKYLLILADTNASVSFIRGIVICFKEATQTFSIAKLQ